MLDFEKAYDRVQWSFLEEVMKSLGYRGNGGVLPKPYIGMARVRC